MRRYYLSRREELRQRARDWYTQNTDRAKQTLRSYYDSHRDQITEYGKRYREANADRVAASKKTPDYRQYKSDYDARYRVENHDKVFANKRTRRARQVGAVGRFTADDVAALYTKQRGKCANRACRVSIASGYHVDHVNPLSRGGTNWPENLQLLCPPCNLRKQAKTPEQWAAENGLLFL